MLLHCAIRVVGAVEHLRLIVPFIAWRLEECRPLVRAEYPVKVRQGFVDFADNAARRLPQMSVATHPTAAAPLTYRRLVVERTDVVWANTSRDPLRKELAMRLELHVRAVREGADDGEVLGPIVDWRGRGSLGHVPDAFLKSQARAG